MRTLIVYHEHSELEERILTPWLASFSELVGRVVIGGAAGTRLRRIRREIGRVGPARFLDIAAFRLYYRAVLSNSDRAWEKDLCARLETRLPAVPEGVPTLYTPDPNSDETLSFISGLQPDLVLARCRVLLDERVFSIPPLGTFVLHPGIVPEYRNSHGCFWALAHRDLDRVGMTLLKIDAGVDTGPVYGFYTYDFDERRESHVRIQKRMVTENLDSIRSRLEEIAAGRADPVDVSGRRSAAWGQPWLTKYLNWKRQARASA